MGLRGKPGTLYCDCFISVTAHGGTERRRDPTSGSLFTRRGLEDVLGLSGQLPVLWCFNGQVRWAHLGSVHTDLVFFLKDKG